MTKRFLLTISLLYLFCNPAETKPSTQSNSSSQSWEDIKKQIQSLVSRSNSNYPTVVKLGSPNFVAGLGFGDTGSSTIGCTITTYRVPGSSDDDIRRIALTSADEIAKLSRYSIDNVNFSFVDVKDKGACDNIQISMSAIVIYESASPWNKQACWKNILISRTKPRPEELLRSWQNQEKDIMQSLKEFKKTGMNVIPYENRLQRIRQRYRQGLVSKPIQQSIESELSLLDRSIRNLAMEADRLGKPSAITKNDPRVYQSPQPHASDSLRSAQMEQDRAAQALESAKQVLQNLKSSSSSSANTALQNVESARKNWEAARKHKEEIYSQLQQEKLRQEREKR